MPSEAILSGDSSTCSTRRSRTPSSWSDLESKAYDAKKCCTLPDRDNCLDMVNQECNLLKSLLRSHSGFRAADI